MWLFPLLFVIQVYCVVQAVRDFRRGDRLMALLGAACAVALLLAPMPRTYPVLIDLPRPSDGVVSALRGSRLALGDAFVPGDLAPDITQSDENDDRR